MQNIYELYGALLPIVRGRVDDALAGAGLSAEDMSLTLNLYRELRGAAAQPGAVLDAASALLGDAYAKEFVACVTVVDDDELAVRRLAHRESRDFNGWQQRVPLLGQPKRVLIPSEKEPDWTNYSAVNKYLLASSRENMQTVWAFLLSSEKASLSLRGVSCQQILHRFPEQGVFDGDGGGEALSASQSKHLLQLLTTGCDVNSDDYRKRKTRKTTGENMGAMLESSVYAPRKAEALVRARAEELRLWLQATSPTHGPPKPEWLRVDRQYFEHNYGMAMLPFYLQKLPAIVADIADTLEGEPSFCSHGPCSSFSLPDGFSQRFRCVSFSDTSFKRLFTVLKRLDADVAEFGGVFAKGLCITIGGTGGTGGTGASTSTEDARDEVTDGDGDVLPRVQVRFDASSDCVRISNTVKDELGMAEVGTISSSGVLRFVTPRRGTAASLEKWLTRMQDGNAADVIEKISSVQRACVFCSRPITSPSSIKAGAGDKCMAKFGAALTNARNQDAAPVPGTIDAAFVTKRDIAQLLEAPQPADALRWMATTAVDAVAHSELFQALQELCAAEHDEDGQARVKKLVAEICGFEEPEAALEACMDLARASVVDGWLPAVVAEADGLNRMEALCRVAEHFGNEDVLRRVAEWFLEGMTLTFERSRKKYVVPRKLDSVLGAKIVNRVLACVRR